MQVRIHSRSENRAHHRVKMPWGEVVESSQPRVASGEIPEDVAALYSWANLRGARYRDFSADRARVREEARKRVQAAMQAERERAEAASAGVAVTTPKAVDAADQPPAVAEISGAHPSADFSASSFAEADVSSADGFSPEIWPAAAEKTAASPAQASPRQMPEVEPRIPFQAFQPQMGQVQSIPVQPVQPAAPRWFALQGIFPAASFAEPARMRARVPALAVFSLAGGVGKTSLVAALGRALTARGERVLLVDTAPFGMLPFFFGATGQRTGMLRTFTASGMGDGSGTRMDVLSLDIERFGPEGNVPEPFTQEILRHAGAANRILIDLCTASGATVRRILRMTPTVLVPLTPDMGSVASVTAIEAFFEGNTAAAGLRIAPYYLLNQFDESLRLHRAVLELLRERLGEQLLPFVMRRAAAVSEALAEGMTVIDYAPDSPAAIDYAQLADWMRSVEAPAARGYGGVRWSER